MTLCPSQCARELTKEELLSLVMGPKTVDFGVVSVSSVTTQHMMMINTLDRCAREGAPCCIVPPSHFTAFTPLSFL